eukprot:TRINITY_DN23033_c0_g1_i1.p1 TRINITY_DN23033_c0_g1~~TRINITY_DN23033_c0_g1_i1.p1  ORF type:complete len:338 (+),score=34.11 TRINITY_DN23033_c0_g1_i1:82-1095(+)
MGSLCCCANKDTTGSLPGAPGTSADVITPGGAGSGVAETVSSGMDKCNKLDELLKSEDSLREGLSEQIPDLRLSVMSRVPHALSLSQKKTEVPPAIVCSGCGYTIAYGDSIVKNPEVRVSVDDSRKCIVILQSVSAAEPVTHEPKPPRKTRPIFKTFGGDIYGTLNAPPHSFLMLSSSSASTPLKCNEVCPNCSIFLGIVLSHYSEGVTKRYVHLGIRYIRYTNPTTSQPITDRTAIRCASCLITLSYSDQILCTKRRWAMGQHACYMNSLVYENVSLSSPREERLAQGKFIMADISCACGKAVGYKFCQDLSRNSRNVYQVGRFGLISSLFVIDGM